MAKTIASGLFIVRKDKKVLICHPTNHPKDFYSITSIVLGITSVSIVVMEGETEYIDKDIPLEITEIFVLGNIDVEQTN